MPIKQIELRQSLCKNTIVNNGDFTIDLAGEPIKIKEGDTISIKNAFIDTRKNSAQGTINLTEDQRVSMTFMKYIMDHTAENDIATDAARGRDYQGSVKADHPRAKKYLLCDATGSTNLQSVSKIYFLMSYDFKGPDGYRSLTYTFNYTNAGGTQTTFSFDISKDQAQNALKTIIGEYGIYTYTLPNPIIIQPNTLSLNQPSVYTMMERQGFYWNPAGFQGTYPSAPQNKSAEITDISVANGFKEFEETFSFTIPQGEYTPADLASLISRNLSTNKDGKVDITGNKILTYAGKFDNTKNYAFCAEDGNDYYVVGPHNNFWLGANEIAFDYNEDTQRFEITYLHMPFYSEIPLTSGGTTTSGNIVNKLIQTGAGEDIIIGSAGGVCISAWTSSFFEDILGFDDSVLTKITSYNVKNIGGNDVHIPIFNTVDGVNTTTGFTGLDNLVEKTSTTWFLVPSLFDFESTTDVTTSISAQKVIQPQTEEKFSHYNIDLQCGFSNEYINGQHIRKNINAIVSKYYSADSYTIYQDTSVAYVHKGNDCMLSTIHVRILDPDFKVPDIGEDNTLILVVDTN